MKSYLIAALLIAAPTLAVAESTPARLMMCYSDSPSGLKVRCTEDPTKPPSDETSLFRMYSEGWRLVGTQANNPDNAVRKFPYYFFLERTS